MVMKCTTYTGAETLVEAAHPAGSVHDMVRSGARASIGNLTQMAGMKGPEHKSVTLSKCLSYFDDRGLTRGVLLSLTVLVRVLLTPRLEQRVQDTTSSSLRCCAGLNHQTIVLPSVASPSTVFQHLESLSISLMQFVSHTWQMLLDSRRITITADARTVAASDVANVVVRHQWLRPATASVQPVTEWTHHTGDRRSGEAVGRCCTGYWSQELTTMRTFHAGGTASVVETLPQVFLVLRRCLRSVTKEPGRGVQFDGIIQRFARTAATSNCRISKAGSGQEGWFSYRAVAPYLARHS